MNANKKHVWLVLIVCSGMFLSSCGKTVDTVEEPARQATFTVYTVNYPLQYFTERIGGDRVEAVFLCPEGEDPAFWQPDAETIRQYQQADLIFLNGAGYAKWVTHASLPPAKTFDTSETFKEQYIWIDDTVTNTHGPEREQAHITFAAITWLDLSLATEQAKVIANTLINRLPEHRTEFMKNYAVLRNDLLKLDEEIKMIVTPAQALPLVASRPIYQYFARRYGLNIVSVHWDPGEIPTVEQKQELNTLLKDNPVEWMLWEGYPSKETVDLLEKMGIGRLVFQPCGNKVSGGDFLAVMRQNVDNLKEVYRK
jgi:zinc transport system substrate-binding protein